MKELLISNIVREWKNIYLFYKVKWENNFIEWDIIPNHITADFSVNISKIISSNQNNKRIGENIIKNFPHYLKIKLKLVNNYYINCIIPLDYYTNELKVQNQKLKKKRKENNNKVVNIEYVSANPTGRIHLGHLRNGIVGKSISEIYSYYGFKVIREYYINDQGNQIDKLVNSILSIINKKDDEGLEYSGNDIREASKNLFFIREMEERERKKIVIDYFIGKIREDLLSFGIIFDKWSSEKSLFADITLLAYLKSKISELKKKGLVYEQDGAIFFSNKILGDDKDRVIVRNNGKYTYFFSDILYHVEKMNRSDMLINVWGSDHHGYVKRVIDAINTIEGKRKKIRVVLTQLVNIINDGGEKEKFSKRLGNYSNIIEIKNDRNKLKLLFLSRDINKTIDFKINNNLIEGVDDNNFLENIKKIYQMCILREGQLKSDDFVLEIINTNKIFKQLVKINNLKLKCLKENRIHYLVEGMIKLIDIFQNTKILLSNDYKIFNFIKKEIECFSSICGIIL